MSVRISLCRFEVLCRRFLAVVLCAGLLAPSAASAANLYWAGNYADSDRWENAANWSTTVNGSGGGGIPGAADIAIFTSATGSETVRIRSAVNVYGLVLASTWSGSIAQGTGTIVVGNEGVKVGSGRLAAGNAAFTVRGAFTQTGGIVTGMMNTLTVTGSLSLTKAAAASYATFTSTGTLALSGKADQNFTVGANVVKSFKNLTLNNTGGGTSDDIVTNVNGGLFLSGALTVTLGNLDLTTNSVALVFESGATLANDAQATLTTNSNVTASGTIKVNDSAVLTVTAGTWTLNDDGDQAVDLDGQSLYGLTINNTGGGTNDDVIIGADSQLNLSGALTITLGNLDLTTNTETMVVDRGITLADAAQATLTTNSNVTASGTITVNNAASITVSAGTWTLNDDSDQTVDFDGQSLFNLTINNTGGGTIDDVVVAADGQINLSGALTITLGNLDLTTNTETMVLDRGLTIADAAQATLTTNSTVTASGTILVNDAATITVTGGAWILNDDGDQSFDIDGQPLFDLTINNTGGGTNDDVSVAGGTLQLSGALTVTLGNLDLDSNNLGFITEAGITIANTAQATFVTDGNVNASGSIATGAAGSFTMSGNTTLTMNGVNQNLDTNGAILTALTIASTATTTLTSSQVVRGTLQVNTGATLSLGAFKIHATGSTIRNYGTINENTGAMTHTGSNFLVTNSDYTETATFTAGCTANYVHFTLTDSDENISGTARDTVAITLTAGTDTETITLTETTNTSGVFRDAIGAVVATVVASNNRLEATASTSISISYTDSQDGLTNSDTATLDVATCTSSTTSTTGGGSGGGGRGSGGGGAKAPGKPPVTPPVTAPPPGVKSPALSAREKALLKRKEAQEKRKALLEKRKQAAAERRKAAEEKRKKLLEQRRKK